MNGRSIPGLSMAEYQKIDAVNWGALKAFRISPLHYLHRTETKREDADHFRLGRATHTAVFEPDRFPLEYVVWTGERRAGKKWDDFEAIHAGVTILTMAQYKSACGIRDAVRAHPVAAGYIREGTPEVSLVWTDDETQRACKARPDFVGSAIVDLKTAKTIDQFRFASAVATLAYHCQLAWYQMGWRVVTGVELPCALIAVESEAPHDVAAYRMGENALYAGAKEIRELLSRLVDCEHAGKFPGRYPREVDLRLPEWAKEDEADE